MKSSHVLALKFIIALKDNKYVEYLDIFEDKDENWEYYYQVSAKINGKPFFAFFSKHKITSIEKLEIQGKGSEEITKIIQSL